MIDVSNLTVSFAGTPIFFNIGFKLTPGNRVGLIGRNGAGKSTLLRVISGDQEYEGTFAVNKNTRIGFLKQDIDFNKGKTILEETYLAFEEILSIEKTIDRINSQLAQREDYQSQEYEDLLHQLDDLNNRFKLIGGYDYKGEAERILQGLGFRRTEFNSLTETLSGGWRMRIELAKLLLQKNDVLLLDEPTNHLDINSILWFEDFLKAYKGIVLVVSHDRMFLDNITNRTIEISLGSIYDYKKPFSQYLKIRKELMEKQLQAKKNQDKQIKQTEELIEKFRYKATKASFAQSLIKKLDKIERIQVDVSDNSTMNVRFPSAKAPGKVLFTLENIAKNYGDKKVLENINFLFERGNKIAFVGQNGMGKTTLAKILTHEIDFKGKLVVGHNVKIGYFAQNQSDYLNGENTLIKEMESVANDSNRIRIRAILGSFLFGEDAIDKKVKVLSGGERNRLALAKMLLNPFNVLIMDEPTNHLDMLSKTVLKNALKEFEGSLVLVSHDRDFLSGLVDKVYEFRDNKVMEHLGGIEYYLEKRKFDSFRDVEKNSNISTKSNIAKKNTWEEEKMIKRIKNKINKLEISIGILEKEIINLDAALFDNDQIVTENPDFFDLYKSKKDTLEQMMFDWSVLNEELDK